MVSMHIQFKVYGISRGCSDARWSERKLSLPISQHEEKEDRRLTYAISVSNKDLEVSSRSHSGGGKSKDSG